MLAPLGHGARLVLAVLTLVGVCGCASSRVPAEPPATLDQVNAQLQGRWARIQQTNGQVMSRVENVQIGPDSTSCYHRLDERRMTLPTASIEHVAVRGQTGSGRGLAMGAAPGGAAAAIGAGILIASAGDDRSIGHALVGMLLLGGGALAGIVGGITGALVGEAAVSDAWITVYRGPVRRYRTSQPE